MAIAAAIQYTVRFHVDNDGYPYSGNSADANFNKNIVFDGLDVEPFNDGSIATPYHAVCTVVVGNNPGNELDSFSVQFAYPKNFPGTDPATLRVNDHIVTAFAVVNAIILQTFPPVATYYVDIDLPTNAVDINGNPVTVFAGGGPSAIIDGFTLAGGTGYPNLTNYVVKMSGGSGYGAVATITATGGAVTAVVINTPGVGYKVNDVLTANIGVNGSSYPAVPGSGFGITVNSVKNPITNTTYA